MKTNATNGWAVTGLIHTYVGPKAAQVTNANAGAAVSWPYWVEAHSTVSTKTTPYVQQ